MLVWYLVNDFLNKIKKMALMIIFYMICKESLYGISEKLEVGLRAGEIET